jgi:hypothetical protein
MSDLTGFAGFVFDGGYDYRRARSLLIALRRELAEKMPKLYPALPHGKEKHSGEGESAWDVFAKRKDFTLDPHFTLSIHEDGPYLSLTIPDKARYAWIRLGSLARERTNLELSLKVFLRDVLRVPRSQRPIIQFKLIQRHWQAIQTDPRTDAQLFARLDTMSICPSSLRARGVKQQQGWYEAILALLAAGKGNANWEFQIHTHFEMGQAITAKPELKQEMVRILKAFRPVYDLLLGKP